MMIDDDDNDDDDVGGVMVTRCQMCIVGVVLKCFDLVHTNSFITVYMSDNSVFFNCLIPLIAATDHHRMMLIFLLLSFSIYQINICNNS